jgi:GTP-binding protein
MKTSKAEFIFASTNPDQMPVSKLPEIAFAGRSNVGKSSLINSLVQRKELARTSSSPGKTRQINFFSVDNEWLFADLPGFGYAKVSKQERDIWSDLNQYYLLKRQNLRGVILLVDSRHEPMAIDLAMMELLENNNKKFVVVMTKSDKIKETLIEKRKTQFSALLKNCINLIEILPYSSVTGAGRPNLNAIIKRLCG